MCVYIYIYIYMFVVQSARTQPPQREKVSSLPASAENAR